MTTSLAENPIIVDSAGVVISGHGRLLAARLLGLDDLPVVEVPAQHAKQAHQ
jgi:ParB-like chromosome segregation protein Spo0J